MRFTYLDNSGNPTVASEEIHTLFKQDDPTFYIGFFSYFENIKKRFLRVAKKHKKTINNYPKEDIPYSIQRLSPAFKEEITQIHHLFGAIKKKDIDNPHWLRLHRDTHNCVPVLKKEDKMEDVILTIGGQDIETQVPNTINLMMLALDTSASFTGRTNFGIDGFITVASTYFSIYYINHCFLTEGITLASVEENDLNAMVDMLKSHIIIGEDTPRRYEKTPFQQYTKVNQPLFTSLKELENISDQSTRPLISLLSDWFEDLNRSADEMGFAKVTQDIINQVDKLFVDIDEDELGDYAHLYAGILFLNVYTNRWTDKPVKRPRQKKNYQNKYLETKKEAEEIRLKLHHAKRELKERDNQSQRIEELQKQLIPLQNVRDRNKLLQEDLDQAHKEIEQLKRQLQEKQHPSQEATSEEECDLLERLQEKLNHDKAIIIGGNPSWLANMKKHFPNARYYDADEAGTRISTHIRAMDTVLMNTQYMNHPTYNKTKDILDDRFKGECVTIKGAHINADLILKELAEGFGMN